ncbi:ATP-binding cassette domain-containing protein [Xenophilus aerolatus]|nr:ATP-binding cassette domain-containing protein [Xenophilus aerolatus]
MTAPATAPLLQLRDLRVAFPGEAPLIDCPSLALPCGLTLIEGDTGSGKTTLLRVLAGELPAQGTLALAGIKFAQSPQAYRRAVFHVDARDPAFDALTPRACAAAWREDDPRFDAARWSSMVEGFALGEHLDKRMDMLSTGSRRKVVLAAALASGRALVLLDEPTAALDKASVRWLWQALAESTQRRARQAIVVASNLPVEGLPLAATITLPLR